MCKEVEGFLPLDHPLVFNCSLCGQEDNLDEYNSCAILDIMRQKQVCFNCAFWIDKINNPPIGQEIIGGHHYIVHPFVKRPENIIKGFLGREFYIRKLDGTLIKSNNVWHQGKIPEHFKNQFPDTANFLPLMIFQRLANDPHICKAKGCWDRYHCLRYDKTSEGDIPFNIVPESHCAGDEHCPSFINKNVLTV